MPILNDISNIGSSISEDPWVLYLVVRESLNMSPGKTCAQIGHAVGMAYKYLHSKEVSTFALYAFECWENECYRKVVLKANDKEWEKIKQELDVFLVVDLGLTQVEPNSETCLACFPMKKSEQPKLLKRLQLLK